MNILKATFFKNGSHEIRPVTCANITETAVAFNRTSSQAQATHSSQKIESRQHLTTRYCMNEAEAIRFIDSMYQQAINELERKVKSHEQSRAELFSNTAQEVA